MKHYTRYRSNTTNKLTFFQKVLAFSGGKQSFNPCLIVLFGILLLRLDTVLTHTVGITEYKGHLNLKCSTAKRHIKTMLLCPTYSLLAAEFIHQDVTI